VIAVDIAPRRPPARAKARAVIAGSMEEARAFASARVVEIDAEIADWQDNIATAQDNIAYAMDQLAAREARSAELTEAASARSVALGELRATLAGLDAEAVAAREALQGIETYLAEIIGAPDEFIGKREKYEEEVARLEAEADAIGMALSDSRGLARMIGESTENAKIEEITDRIAYVRNSVLPAIEESYQRYVREVAEMQASAVEFRAYIADIEARYAEQALAWEQLAADVDGRAERDQVAAEIDAWRAALDDQRQWLTGADAAVAALRTERADMEIILQ